MSDCCKPNRRKFLSEIGMGFGALAIGDLLARDGIVRASEDLKASENSKHSPPNGIPHHRPRAKSVIWVFLSGGYSHLETFDPKPALKKYAGKTFSQTPFENPVNSPLHKKRFRSVPAESINIRDVYSKIYPMQIGWKKHGQTGIEVTDWWPNLAKCVDDMCFVRNMWTTDNDHAAENQIHTGRHRLDENQPSIGSWAHFGLGAANENLPKFVVLGGPTRTDTRDSIDSYYLGPEHAGVPLDIDAGKSLPFGVRHKSLSPEFQKNEFELISDLNKITAEENPRDQELAARIKSYELAFKMQTSVPDAVDLKQETEETKKLYGLDQNQTKIAGKRLLTARRLAEKGVRFIQVFPSSYGVWDSHNKLRQNHAKQCKAIDKPIAGLLIDLKRRGMLEDTVVIFCTEFGRTPGLEERSGGTTGRDHHPNGFTIWMAGAGVKRGYVHGATDELGYNALGQGHYVTDLHSTVLHLLGLDNRKLEIPGRKRLDIDRGKPILDCLT